MEIRINRPGLTEESTHFAIVEVIGPIAEASPEEHEEMERLELPMAGLLNQLTKLQSEGLRLDAKLWRIAAGLDRTHKATPRNAETVCNAHTNTFPLPIMRILDFDIDPLRVDHIGCHD